VTAVVCFPAAACRRVESGSAAPAPHAIESRLDAAIARGVKEGRPVFVHFTAAWCLPCKQIKESIYPDPAVADRLARFVRAEIDIESPAGEASAQRYGVRAIPVLTVIDPRSGEELRSFRMAGVETPSTLVAVLDRALAQSGGERAGAAASAGEATPLD
jgi:thiol:disulfide interchange protein DsbD